jgi:hypothetical protein
MSGMSPDLPGAVTFAPGLRGGGIASRRIGPTNYKGADTPTGAGYAGGGLPGRGEQGEEVGKEMNKPNTNKQTEVTVWDLKERERLLTGATVVKVTWDTRVLEKDGKRIVVEADCFACGYGRFIVTVRE